MGQFKMKYRALFATAALLSSSIISSPAWADTIPTPTAAGPDSTTLDAMQTQCDALAAAHDTGNGDIWSAQVVQGAATLVAGPTEVEGTRVVDEESIVGTGTFVPSTLEIRSGPFRIGGSVNMFGDQWATAGYYPDSTYNYTADFTSTFSYAFSCDIYDAVYHAAVHHDATPPEGYYTNNGTHPSEGEGSCQGLSPANPNWGHDLGNCIWTQTAPGQPAYDDPAYNDEAVFVVNEAGTPINQDQTDNLSAFEDHGGPVQVTGEYHVGQVVICISPGSKGGSWRTQNGYGGGSLTGPAAGCNTPYFKVAPWWAGSTTSNGTWVSVPDYNL
jgi:hypothetical protein